MSNVQDFINRMPGGKRYIGANWREEPVDQVVVIVVNDTSYDDESCYARDMFNAVLTEYGPPVNDNHETGPILRVPELIAELLMFWSDSEQFGFSVDITDEGV